MKLTVMKLTRKEVETLMHGPEAGVEEAIPSSAVTEGERPGKRGTA